MTPPRGEVTGLLAELRSGNKEALAKLIPLVYNELHRLAEHYMRNERVGHTLQPTALITKPTCGWRVRRRPTGSIVRTSWPWLPGRCGEC